MLCQLTLRNSTLDTLVDVGKAIGAVQAYAWSVTSLACTNASNLPRYQVNENVIGIIVLSRNGRHQPFWIQLHVFDTRPNKKLGME